MPKTMSCRPLLTVVTIYQASQFICQPKFILALHILNSASSTILPFKCNIAACEGYHDQGLPVSYVFVPGDVDPRHGPGEGARASADRKWEAVSGRDKAERNNKSDPPLQQGQPQRHTVRTATARQRGKFSEEWWRRQEGALYAALSTVWTVSFKQQVKDQPDVINSPP